MSLSIKNIKTENKLKQNNQSWKCLCSYLRFNINSGYNPDSYNLILFIETEPN
jgi:hypothetical protein